MRPTFFSLTCAAGALVMLLSFPAKAGAEGCCGVVVDTYAPAADAAVPKAEGAKAEGAKPPAGLEAAAAAAAPKAGEPAALPKAAPTPLDLSDVEVIDRSSYSDVFRILSFGNSCSEYFGGPRLALTAFNKLSLQLRRRALGHGPVGIMMSGSYTVYHDTMTGETYRLFDEAVVNSNGPFGSRVRNPLAGRLQVGRFPAETRQARALILLHELGHLVAAPGGAWLLPDDGGNARQSERNTETVETRCLKQLLALKD